MIRFFRKLVVGIDEDTDKPPTSQERASVEVSKVHISGQGSLTSNVETEFKSEVFHLGLDRQGGTAYAQAFDGLELTFAPDARWRLDLPKMKRSKKDPEETLRLIYWGGAGLYLSIDNLTSYNNPALRIPPQKAWTKATNSTFSLPFRETVLICLIAWKRFKLPSDILLLPFTYLGDFICLQRGSCTTITIIEDSLPDFPEHGLFVKSPNGFSGNIFSGKFGFEVHATLVALNLSARKTIHTKKSTAMLSDR